MKRKISRRKKQCILPQLGAAFLLLFILISSNPKSDMLLRVLSLNTSLSFSRWNISVSEVFFSFSPLLSSTLRTSSPESEVESAAPPKSPSPVTMPPTAKPTVSTGISESSPPVISTSDTLENTSETQIFPVEISDIKLTNSTEYEIDIEHYLSSEIENTLPQSGPQILIIHTHASESYTPEAEELYVESDYYRTEDRQYNVVRVGDELTAALEQRGFCVIHDRSIYDYPSYTGSYSRSLESVENYLEKYPEIGIIIDLHRDALSNADGSAHATDGDGSAQVMMVLGSGASGLAHPNWEQNLSLALHLQRSMLSLYPALCRPVSLTGERYNQHMSPGYFILEVGSTGNTLNEALTAVRRFAQCAAPVFNDLIG